MTSTGQRGDTEISMRCRFLSPFFSSSNASSRTFLPHFNRALLVWVLFPWLLLLEGDGHFSLALPRLGSETALVPLEGCVEGKQAGPFHAIPREGETFPFTRMPKEREVLLLFWGFFQCSALYKRFQIDLSLRNPFCASEQALAPRPGSWVARPRCNLSLHVGRSRLVSLWLRVNWEQALEFPV